MRNTPRPSRVAHNVCVCVCVFVFTKFTFTFTIAGDGKFDEFVYSTLV